MARSPRTRKSTRKTVPVGRAYIQSTFNNTLITLTDAQGNTIAWGSAGSVGFSGSRKSTAFAAQRAAETAARKGMDHGLRQVEVLAKKYINKSFKKNNITVQTLTESVLSTVAIAFPAYIGLLKVFSSTTSNSNLLPYVR